MGDRVALQGNLDPDIIKNEVKVSLVSFGKGTGHVFNLGHGFIPEVDPHHTTVLTKSVRDYSPVWHED